MKFLKKRLMNKPLRQLCTRGGIEEIKKLKGPKKRASPAVTAILMTKAHTENLSSIKNRKKPRIPEVIEDMVSPR